MDLYKLHTVHVPLDKDTYDGHEHKYTRLNLKQNHLAISKEEYIDLQQHQLNSCLKLHTDYLCPNLRITASTQVLSCAAAVFQSKPNDNLIRDLCDITYHEYIRPPPTVLETQDEILLANLPPTWQFVCDNQIDRPIPLHSAIYAIINKNDLCTCGISAQHIFLYESMCTCENPDTSVTLYYTDNRALLAYDPSLQKQKQSLDQYQTTIPGYRAPDIFYQKKKFHDNPIETNPRLKRDIWNINTVHTRNTTNKRYRYHRDTYSTKDIVTNISVDDLLSLSFPLLDTVDFMETGKTFYLPSTQQECPRPKQLPVPITQDIDFYFNIVTVINFLTSVINAIIISICYKKCKDLLASILTVTMDTLQQNPQVQALRFSDDELSTATVDTTTVDSNNTDYFQFTITWIVLIVFLSILLLLVLYWIIVLLIVPLTRKSSVCRYLFSCHKPYGNFLTPATDIFLDVVHVALGEQIRVFLTTITAPPCSLSFTGSGRIQNFRLSRKHLLSTLYIDWHNCILHYNEHVITLPPEGTAFSFQPNLLTIFSRPGPYNIQLLARHMDALLQIPHASDLDFITASDLLVFPHRNPVNPLCPYQQIHDEVLSMMPLSDTPSASDPTLVDSTSQNEQFV